jgi:hypothetical protein
VSKHRFRDCRTDAKPEGQARFAKTAEAVSRFSEGEPPVTRASSCPTRRLIGAELGWPE